MRLKIAQCAVIQILLASVICAEEPIVVSKPDAFRTLVNPECSHCIDEAKRRQDELKASDPVLCWTRGKYEGGAIPFRFFLNSHRVISDTYGTFVYDPDAGFARAFTASIDFRFDGWRNGVMVMKHKDGTRFSTLTGIAFDGPRRGERLKNWPTIVADWGWFTAHYPSAVAYRMHDQFKPIELPTVANDDSKKSRPKLDERLNADERVLGVEASKANSKARAYRLADLEKAGAVAALTDEIDLGVKVIVLWQASTRTATAYFPVAEKFKAARALGETGEVEETMPGLQIEVDSKAEEAPFVDRKTGSHFDIAGRCVEGKLKGWCLKPAQAIMVKWFAWSAEFSDTSIYKKETP